MTFNVGSTGAVIAIVVLIICVVLAVVGDSEYTRLLILALIGALAVARLS